MIPSAVTNCAPAFGQVYGPVRRGQGFAFDRPKLWSEVELSYPRTVLPPKKFVLPPRECTFHFDEQKGYEDRLAEASRPIVVLGVHPYDLYALNILSRVFAAGKFADPYFTIRRQNTTLIGVDFEPDVSHFASSMNADVADTGFDLFLSDLGEEYLVLVGTSRGHDMVTMSGCLLAEPTPADFAEYKRRSGLRRAAYQTRVELNDLAEILEIDRIMDGTYYHYDTLFEINRVSL